MDAWIPLAAVGAACVAVGVVMLTRRRSSELPGNDGTGRALERANARDERAKRDDDATASPSKRGASSGGTPEAKKPANSPEFEEDTLYASRDQLRATVEQAERDASAKSDAADEASKAEPARDDATAQSTTSAPNAQGAKSADSDDEAPPVGSEHTGPHALIVVHGTARTDPGLRRKNNEDRFLVLGPPHHVYVVADGMGGHAAGEVASQTAVDTMEQAFLTETFPGEPRIQEGRPRRADELVRSVEAANTAVYEKAQSNEAYEKMGTTLVAARFSPNNRTVFIAHVGDSRCYRVRKGVLEQITTDHTLGQMLGIKGREAGRLTRAVGIEPQVDIDLLTDLPQAEDHYLLCSDGLTRMLPDEVILEVLDDESDLEKAAQKLVTLANDKGGRDNITVIVLRISEPEDAVARGERARTSEGAERDGAEASAAGAADEKALAVDAAPRASDEAPAANAGE